MSSNNKRRVSKVVYKYQKKTTGHPIIYMNKITEKEHKKKDPVSTKNKPSKYYSNCHKPCKKHKSHKSSSSKTYNTSSSKSRKSHKSHKSNKSSSSKTYSSSSSKSHKSHNSCKSHRSHRSHKSHRSDSSESYIYIKKEYEPRKCSKHKKSESDCHHKHSKSNHKHSKSNHKHKSSSPKICPIGPRGPRGYKGSKGSKGSRGPRGHHRSAHYLNRKINNLDGQDYSGGMSIYLPIMNNGATGLIDDSEKFKIIDNTTIRFEGERKFFAIFTMPEASVTGANNADISFEIDGKIHPLHIRVFPSTGSGYVIQDIMEIKGTIRINVTFSNILNTPTLNVGSGFITMSLVEIV